MDISLLIPDEYTIFHTELSSDRRVCLYDEKGESEYVTGTFLNPYDEKKENIIIDSKSLLKNEEDIIIWIPKCSRSGSLCSKDSKNDDIICMCVAKITCKECKYHNTWDSLECKQCKSTFDNPICSDEKSEQKKSEQEKSEQEKSEQKTDWNCVVC